MRKQFKFRWLYAMILSLLAFSCSEDGEDPKPVASFQFEVDESDFLTINFTNFSKNADTYSWDFGDDSPASTDEEPSHTYEEPGVYSVTLTATNDEGTSTQTKEISITDPNEALAKLAGTVSKTWKLYRVGTSMSLGPNAENPAQWWSGLTNNGTRPCLYQQTFTFTRSGQYIFDDKDAFWAEYGVFNNVAGCTNNTAESCIDAVAANMKNACNEDVSAWLSDTHAYTYNTATGELTLTGLGAWIGIPKLGTSGETRVPVSEVKTKITITENEGYDVMKVEFIYEGAYWPIYYASYSDPSLEPDLQTEPTAWGENLNNITPTELSHTFASADGGVNLATIGGASIITLGVNDPQNAANPKVGKFERVAGTQYQEAIIKAGTSTVWNDVTFVNTNITTITMDVYLPSSNTYTGSLNKKVVIGLADQSATEQWWNRLIQYESAELALDSWQTVTFQVNTPSFASLGDNPFDRTDLDMVYITIGGTGHNDGGTFYIRNLKFYKP